jgi:hypothetical protein
MGYAGIKLNKKTFVCFLVSLDGVLGPLFEPFCGWGSRKPAKLKTEKTISN